MTELVMIQNEELLVSTWDLAKGFDVEHRSIKILIDTHKDDFEEVGERKIEPLKRTKVSSFEMTKPTHDKGGRPVEEFLLNEPQATFLITLVRNNKKVLAFKKRLTKEFYKQRKLLIKLIAQKQNVEWLAKRDSGKLERRVETDTIKKFVDYAISQGSSNASKYYMIITKMENQSLFHFDFLDQKFPNLRDVLDGCGLNAMESADRIVGLALREGMEKGIPYKECYQLARDRVESYAKLIGKTPLRLTIKENNQKLISVRG